MAFRNQRICEIFEKLRSIRLQQGKEWRGKAYEKIIPILRGYHKEIESGAEAKSIPGIGDRMAAKIDEILLTGTVAELKSEIITKPQSEKDEVLRIFESIEGVGPKTASKWYEQGYRKISDIPATACNSKQWMGIQSGKLISKKKTNEPVDPEKNRVIKLFNSIEGVGDKTAQKWYNLGYRNISDIPASTCNDRQLIGIQLHHELSQRIPRVEIEKFEQILHELLDPQNIQFQICGSYRRGKADSGDIDILVIAKPDVDVVAEILKCPVFIPSLKLAYGDKKYAGICKIDQLHRRVDIELVQPHEYPYAVVYFSGPAKFNVKMRDHASKLGVRLNEKSLTVKVKQSQITPDGIIHESYVESFYPARDEKHVFELLGIQYLTPEERELYA